jgi:hypothetical protein
MRLEAVDDSIDFIDVNSPEAARCIRFLGSPSVRVAALPPSKGRSQMTIEKTANESRDVLRSRRLAIAVYGLPFMALIAAGFPPVRAGEPPFG